MKKKENILYLKLSEEDNEIVLSIVNSIGNTIPSGTLLSISAKGLYLCDKVNTNVALPLDSDGRLLIRKE